MRQIELHIFFNRGGGVTKWKPELYSEYFGYEAIGAEIHSVSDIFFFNLWPIASIPYLHQDTRFVLL